MASSSAAVTEEHFEVARHLKRNYAAHSLEGGLFIGGVLTMSWTGAFLGFALLLRRCSHLDAA